ncbi:MAG: hypothetical protein KDK89_22060 [Alphaproteobacteria bacterium]|nr:hypothetical protein [Alphaproteobacteria bacterium]
MGTANLHDFSTRAGHDRHHSRATTAATVVAVLVFIAAVTILAPSIARSAQSPAVLELSAIPETTGSLGAEANPGHDVAIEVVPPGREGLELTARLTDDGGLIERPIHWTITSGAGEMLYSGEAPQAAISVPPGDYGVSIRYDAVRLSSTVTLLQSNRLMVSYVLNAGGIRILPRVKDIGVPTAIPRSQIIALSGPQRGQTIATSALPGEVIRVPAGNYRIESRFETGNVMAAAEVAVKAGRMSAVEIDHKAGLARLAFVGAPDAPVHWLISDASGTAITRADGLSADLVLKPGSYNASASIGAETLTATFTIAAGETRDIILGN